MKKFLASPYGVMCVVLLMYVIKVIAKLLIGHEINSPLITADGFHNASDIFQACLVIGAVFMARLPENSEYPFGRKKIESLFGLVVGLSLLVLAAQIGFDSIKTLAGYWPSDDPSLRGDIPLKMGYYEGFWAMSVTGVSALVSLLVGRYQIRVGRSTKHESVVADGKETLSDGWIEFMAFVGICCEYLFHAPWMEYIGALVVVIFMVTTSLEILLDAFETLMLKSIGKHHEDRIERTILSIAGIIRCTTLKTFRTGSQVCLIAEILTSTNAHVSRLLRQGLTDLIEKYLTENGFSDSQFFLSFTNPPPVHRRVAFFLRRVRNGDADFHVTNGLDWADTIAIVDTTDGKVVRVTRHAVPQVIEQMMTFLAEKRVASVVFYDTVDRELWLASLPGVEVTTCLSPRLPTHGF
ncbi:MAG: cation diffusion facilitator family transporter [Patescibacteria group bacterium]